MLELADFENAKRCLRVKEKKVYDDQKVDDQIEGKLTFDVEEKLHDKKFAQNLSNILLELDGSDFDLKYIQEHGFNTPILFKSKEGLGMKMPDPKLFTVIDVKSYVGARRIIDCFDCATHQQLQMSVHHWVRYYTGTEREKIWNVTSLEFSHTGLARIVDCPTVVRENLDWIMNVWPEHLINEQKDTTNLVENMKYPKVRKYVLMSVAGCYTDFHIDFGGTSVWYHLLKGSKVFWLVPPSEKNLEVYEGWVLSGRQEDVFFGDMVDNCYRVHLVAGDTFMIPTGWIHGVYTCDDSLVFGGNFLHNFNIPMQLKAYDIEENTHVPKKLRFPFYAQIHWYMIKTYVDVLERDIDERRRLEFEADDVDAFKLVKYEMNKEVDAKEEKPKSNWQCVYLTVYELEGLKLICERFRRWSYVKLNYPKDLKEDSMELLDRLEELLQHHEDDDQILACRGINIFKQLKVERPDDVKLPPISPLNTPLNKQYFPATYNPPPEPEKPKEPKKLVEKKVILKNTQVVFENKVSRKKEKEKEKEVQPTAKKKNVIRRVRCNACERCNKENCNTCRFCLDMVKNGGEGRLRKSCQIRFCLDPQLPNYVECKICHKGKSDSSIALLECSICGEIVHRSCLKTKKPCKMSKNVKFCWECPNCYENKNPQNTPTKVEKVKTTKVTNGHVKVNANVKVQNLKNLIQMNKIKINKQDTKESEVSLKRKRKVHVIDVEDDDEEEEDEEEDDDSSDDEPLIKKKLSMLKAKEKSPALPNGHPIESDLETPKLLKSLATLKPIESPLKTLETHQPMNVVRPPPIELPYEHCVLDTGLNHPIPRLLWIRLFTYLSKQDICKCMSVCKSWNQWCLDNDLWREINVSNKPVTPSMLKGTVRRQPFFINLTSTNISCKQLEWLLKRLPHLKGLNLSLNTASAVSSLMRITCPPLKYLNLAWCDAIYDRFMVQLLSPVRGGRASSGNSRLLFVENFILTGCDISDETVDSIFKTLTNLRELDVSHCTRLSENCLYAVLNGSLVCKESLKKLLFIGCPLLTDNIVNSFSCKSDLPELILKKEDGKYQ